jgi:hypothetical protein
MLPRGPATLPPTRNLDVRDFADLGNAPIENIGENISQAALANLAANSDDPVLAMLAQILRTQARGTANVRAYPFTINPPVATHPAAAVIVVQQILNPNPKRKLLYYTELQTVARGAGGVAQSGFTFCESNTKPTEFTGPNINTWINQMLQASYLTPYGGISIAAPAPANAISVIASWGPPGTVGAATAPLQGVIFEGF